MTDRSQWRIRKYKLGEEPPDDDLARLTPGERMTLAWQATLEGWALKTGNSDEPEFRRDIERVVRRGCL